MISTSMPKQSGSLQSLKLLTSLLGGAVADQDSAAAERTYVIIETLLVNPSKSFEEIAADMSNWCSTSTIYGWIASHSGSTTYAQLS